MRWSDKYLNRMKKEADERDENSKIAISVKDLYKSFKLTTEKAW